LQRVSRRRSNGAGGHAAGGARLLQRQHGLEYLQHSHISVQNA
jgi:hypothetical protein